MFSKKEITIIIPLIFLTIAIVFDTLPNSYFTFIRFIVCTFTLYHAWLIKEENTNWLSAFLIIIAILFNPIVPIEFTRQIWIYIDIIIVLFLLALLVIPLFITKFIETIFAISLILYSIIKVVEFSIMHTYLIILAFVFVLIYYYFYIIPDKNNTNDKKGQYKYDHQKTLTYAYVLGVILFVLILLSSYRWDLQEPYYVEASYDYYWIERPEKDRWLNITWNRSYFIEDKEYADAVIESLRYMKEGTERFHFNYENLREMFSIYKRPAYMGEWPNASNSKIVNKQQTMRYLLTGAWDFVTLSTLVTLISIVANYRAYNKDS